MITGASSGIGAAFAAELPDSTALLLAGRDPDRLSAEADRVARPGRSVETVVADVLAANQAFYDAHEARDFPAMEAVWEHADRTVCIHPGWPILRTWPPIAMSWRQIFAGPGRN
ncbi:MAG: SnoaL-like domain-containing protein, partial [Rhodospirillales bacterium]|nr:SnoaL-like domain-containing protein [Rhodospirillales bacterium]